MSINTFNNSNEVVYQFNDFFKELDQIKYGEFLNRFRSAVIKDVVAAITPELTYMQDSANRYYAEN